MAKRFIASELWDKDWFLELPSKYKVLWVYMITKCDVAGVFDPNLKTVSKLLNEKYTEQDVFSVFDNKLKKIMDKWLLVKFINFQYGDNLSPHMVKPINNALRKIGLDLDTVSIQYKQSIHTPKDIDIDKDKEKDIVKDKYLDFVLLTKEEHQKLIESLGGVQTEGIIARLNDYVGSKGVKYKSHYHTILTWARKDNVGIHTGTTIRKAL